MPRWVSLALSLCACTAPLPGPTADSAVRPHDQGAAEQIVVGRALVELVRPVALPPVELGEGALPSLPRAALALPMAELGGVPVRLVRTIYEGTGEGEDGGLPLLLLATDAKDEATTWAHIARLARDPLVHRAEPDRVRTMAAVPTDPHYREQWNLHQINMAAAWDRARGSESVVVAILDTGIVRGHPDLEGRLVDGYDFIADPVNAADGNGRDPDPTDEGRTEPGSSNLHGTHVAGIIGAQSNNGRGVAGVDWRCRLMPVRVLGVQNGTGVDSDIADAIRWSAGRQVGGMPRPRQAAQIINMSFGGRGISFTVQRAVDEAISAGALIVVAAGNGGEDVTHYSPGGLDSVITVGASTRQRARAPYSNYGRRVDLLAPGGDDLEAESTAAGVLSTYRDRGHRDPLMSQSAFTYFALQGTSQAAAHVSGAAALVRSLVPLRQRTLAALLRTTADPTSRCDLDEYAGCGAGLLNVDRLLVLAELQPKCGCQGDFYCFDGRCIDPGDPHPSIFADPVIRGGCEVVSGWGGPASPGPLGIGLLGLGLGWMGRRHRLREGRVR
ncbi:MAG: S8 family serine peptidase [Myxococcales bacterium]|nr:S8 family serine peptidase [Myxococcota bacterium]MDW8283013.1 S8 family serine peptidase [Myxococcales bacterium]